MSRRNYKSLLFSLAALLTAGGALPNLALAEGGATGTSNTERLLMPIVFIGFDTSGSMNAILNANGQNTRYESAIQQLSGTAYTIDNNCTTSTCNDINNLKNSCNTQYDYTRFPRQTLICNNKVCDYKLQFICGKYYNNHKNDSYHDKYSNGFYKAVKNKTCDYVLTYSSGNSCTSTYSGMPMRARTLKYGFDGDTLEDFEKSYQPDGILHDYMNIVKFGWAGMAGWSGSTNSAILSVPYTIKITESGNTKTDESGILYGPQNYSYNAYGASNTAIHNANPAGTSPIFYPTPSDDVASVRKRNEVLISNLRGYIGYTANTPIGGMMAYFNAMFTGEKNSGKIDQALIKQPKAGETYTSASDIKYDVDSLFGCRNKAIILMTDGDSNDTMTKVFENTLNLYKNGVKVYTIAYAAKNITRTGVANPNDDQKKNRDTGLNHIAFYGGTCRDHGHTGELLIPTEPGAKEKFNQYLSAYLAEQTKKIPENQRKYTSCYYNAYEGQALKDALRSIMSEILAGYTSKSKMVTTSAVGKETVLKTVGGKKVPTNGWYNVHSGYKVTIGNMRTTGLQREAYVCRDGAFEFDESLYIDMADKLNARLTGCRTQSIIEGDSSAPKGDCATNRAIFVGDYSAESESMNSGRYAIRPEVIHFTSSNAGVIRSTEIPSDTDATALTGQNPAYHFLSYDIGSKINGSLKKTREANIGLPENYQDVGKYMISPYECLTDVDCLNKSTKATEVYQCDMGKCKLKDSKTTHVYCAPPQTPCPSGSVCLSGQCYQVPTGGCTKHEDCMTATLDGEVMKVDNQVCHVGKCTTGNLKSGDIHDLLASIPLGTIEYASPVIVPPPSLHYSGAEYVAYKDTYGDRDTMMYVPANDGMLHAFILGKNNSDLYKDSMFKGIRSPKLGKSSPGDLEGEELWAFIPKTILPKIHRVTTFSAEPLINVSPVTADIKVPDFNGSGKSEWRSIVVGGFREGGRGYYALDVTDPKQPIILWEIDHLWQSTQGSEALYPALDDATEKMATSAEKEASYHADNKYPFIRMGYSYSEAVITNIVIGNNVEPVAILSAGKPSGNAAKDEKGNVVPDVTGKAIYIVRLYPKSKNDLLVKEIRFDSGITGTPSVFPAGFNSIARLIYVGDENGALHRIDISDSDMNKWRINDQETKAEGEKVLKVADSHGVIPIFDPANIHALNPDDKSYAKVTYKPAVNALTTSGYPDIQIAVANGDSSVIASNPNELHYMAILVDHYNAKYKRYFLNNLDPDKTKATVRNLKPLVLVFDPTPGISSTNGDLVTFSTDSGKQLFEIVAGHGVPPEKIEESHNEGGTGYPSGDDDDDDEGYEDQGGKKSRSAKRDAGGAGSTNPIAIHERQKVMGAPLTYNFKTYFPTFNAPKDNGTVGECNSGFASIWYADRYIGTQRWGRKAQSSVQNQSQFETVRGTNKDKESETVTSFGQKVFADGGFINLNVGTLVYGLTMTPQRVCMKDDGSALSVAAPMLVAQTGAASGVSGASSTGTGINSEGKATDIAPGKKSDIQVMSINEEAIQATATVLSWASVYE